MLGSHAMLSGATPGTGRGLGDGAISIFSMRSNSESPSGNTRLSSSGTERDVAPMNASSNSETEVHAFGSAPTSGELSGGRRASSNSSPSPKSSGAKSSVPR